MKAGVAGVLMMAVLTGCGPEMTDWGVCYGVTSSDDPKEYYAEFGDAVLCVENNTYYDQATCEGEGGTWEVVLQTEGAVVESDILEPLAAEACVNAGYTVACTDDLGFYKAHVEDAADCTAEK